MEGILRAAGGLGLLGTLQLQVIGITFRLADADGVETPVFICICNAYTARQITAVACRGARHVDDAYHRLGNPPVCRRCVPMAQRLIDDHHDSKAGASQAPMASGAA